MSDYKVFIDGVEIPKYVDHRSNLVDFLHKLGLRSKLVCVIRFEPIKVLVDLKYLNCDPLRTVV